MRSTHRLDRRDAWLRNPLTGRRWATDACGQPEPVEGGRAGALSGIRCGHVQEPKLSAAPVFGNVTRAGLAPRSRLGRILHVDNSETPEGLPAQPRGPKDYLDLARSKSATEEQLRWLAGSPYSFVVEAVARHPATPGDVLERLVRTDAKSWNDQSLLLALAEHPASSLAVLTTIARQVPQLLHERDAHPGFAAGIALFRRPDMPEELLLELLDDPDVTTEFRKVAARETARHGRVLDRLRQDRSERVRQTAERRQADP